MKKLSIKSLCLLIFIFPFLIWGIKVVDLGIPDFINEIGVFIFIISYLVFAVVLLKKVWKLLAVKKNKLQSILLIIAVGMAIIFWIYLITFLFILLR